MSRCQAGSRSRCSVSGAASAAIVGERRATPQRERVAEQLGREVGPAGPVPAVALVGEELEPLGVGVGGVGILAEQEPVTGRRRDQQPAVRVAEEPAQPQHVAVHLGRGGHRRRITPQLQDELLDRYHLAWTDEQGGDQRPQLGAPTSFAHKLLAAA